MPDRPPSTSSQSIREAADRLYEAERARRPVPPLGRELADVTQAYAVQQLNIARRQEAGARLVGRKIGLTSRTVQAQLGVDQPDFGALMDDMAVAPGEAVPAGRLIQPRIEAEVAVVLGRDLPGPDLTLVEVTRAVEALYPALEIVDSRIEDWRIGLLDTVADNASSANFVLGADPVDPRGVELRTAGMVLERNGEAASFGVGAACLGHPYQALLWLARAMAVAGEPLRAGQVVLTGALGPMIPFAPGDQMTAHIQGVGIVHARRGSEDQL